MEDPQDFLSRTLIPQCPYARPSSLHSRPSTQILPNPLLQASAPIPSASSSSAATSLQNPSLHTGPQAPPVGMESFSAWVPRDPVQELAEGIRPSSATRSPPGQLQTRNTDFGGMMRGSHGEAFSSHPTLPAYHPFITPYAQMSAFAAGLDHASRPEYAFPVSSSSSPPQHNQTLQSRPPLSFQTLGGTSRTTSVPTDHARATVDEITPQQHSYPGNFSPTAHPRLEVGEQRHPSAVFPHLPNSHPIQNPSFSPRNRSQVHNNNHVPHTLSPPTRTTHPLGHNGTVYEPTSYASILTGSDPHRRLAAATMAYNPDPNGHLNPTQAGLGPSMTAQEHEYTGSTLFRDYLASGRFEQSVQRSYENGELTDPGRPLQDYNDFVAAAAAARPMAVPGNGSSRQFRSVPPAPWGPPGPRHGMPLQFRPEGQLPGGPMRPSRDADEEWSLSMTQAIHRRELQLAAMLEQNRNPSYSHYSSRRATSKAIEGLTKVEIGRLDKEDRSCSICMEPYGEPEPTEGKIEHPVKLPCGHVFGYTCIKTWLLENCTCPSCRRKVESEMVFRRPGGVIRVTTRSEQDHPANHHNPQGYEPSSASASASRPSRRRRTSDMSRTAGVRPRLAAWDEQQQQPGPSSSAAGLGGFDL